MKLFCEAGNHTWERPPQRGRPPLNCPEHGGSTPALTVAPPKKAKRQPPPEREETLWCEVGRHNWSRTGIGRAPKSCPEHKTSGLAPSGISKAIEEVLKDAGHRGFICRCKITPAMTRPELRALGGGCTEPAFCCPVLDSVRRKIGPEH